MSIQEFITAFLVGGLICGAPAFVGGYWLSTHIHDVANKAASAIQRATTIPGNDVAALNSAVTGLGDKLQNATTALGSQIATAAQNTANQAKPS